MATSRIGAAVHKLTRLFLAEPGRRLRFAQIEAILGLDDDETRIVLDALKDAGFLIETSDGLVGCSGDVVQDSGLGMTD